MINEIIFFTDYGLYSQCELSAKKANKKTTYFIADSTEEYLKKRGLYAGKISKPMELWIACDDAAKALKITVPQIIEEACRVATMPEEKKESFWDKFRLPTG